MAAKRTAAKSSSKRRNGEGDSITVLFDVHDRQERRAQMMSKLLATKAGRRKDMIVTLLASLYDHFEATGEVLTPNELAAMLAKAQTVGAPISFSQADGRSAAQAASDTRVSRSQPQSKPSKAPRVAVTSVPAKTSAADIGRAFTASAGAAFFD
jgi:hypothetical protein